MKHYLFVLRHAPHSSSAIQEILDIILTTAAFEQQVSVLFLDDAVFALKSAQQAEKHGAKETAAIFKALELYDIRALYVEQESLQARGLTAAALCLPMQSIARQQIPELFNTADIVCSG